MKTIALNVDVICDKQCISDFYEIHLKSKPHNNTLKNLKKLRNIVSYAAMILTIQVEIDM